MKNYIKKKTKKRKILKIKADLECLPSNVRVCEKNRRIQKSTNKL